MRPRDELVDSAAPLRPELEVRRDGLAPAPEVVKVASCVPPRRRPRRSATRAGSKRWRNGYSSPRSGLAGDMETGVHARACFYPKSPPSTTPTFFARLFAGKVSPGRREREPCFGLRRTNAPWLRRSAWRRGRASAGAVSWGPRKSAPRCRPVTAPKAQARVKTGTTGGEGELRALMAPRESSRAPDARLARAAARRARVRFEAPPRRSSHGCRIAGTRCFLPPRANPQA